MPLTATQPEFTEDDDDFQPTGLERLIGPVAPPPEWDDCPPEETPEAVEWMGNPDEAALGSDLGDRLRRWEVSWNVPFEEHADDVAVAGLDFLADDHRQLGSGRASDLTSRDGTLDPIVIGDREVRQPALGRGPDDRLG